jgi:hypothetical protein
VITTNPLANKTRKSDAAFEMSGSFAQTESVERETRPAPSHLGTRNAIQPHPPYYLNDFTTVIDGVRARYGDSLSGEEHAYLTKLAALSQPARMLYARLINRRGPFFRVSRLDYPEIGKVAPVIEELVAGGLLVRHFGEPAPVQILACFTYPELKAALRGHDPLQSSRRPELLAWLAQWEGYAAWIGGLLARDPVIAVSASDPFAFLRFLFFGELRSNLSDFVTRALGAIVNETVEPACLRPRFIGRKAMEDAYRMAVLYQAFREVRENRSAIECLHWWKAQAINRDTLSAGQEWFDRLVDRLGRLLERAGESAEAAWLYAQSPVAPARERLARLLMKSGDVALALAVLGDMQAAPSHAEEGYAARQLLARLERRSRRTEARAFEIAGSTLEVDYPAAGVEQAVLAYYRQQGWAGVHSENWLWNASFGLLLWDIIYDSTLGVFHSPFQFAPSDLHNATFYARRGARIEARLEMLAEPADAWGVMRKHFEAKRGVVNPFVAWHDNLLEVMEIMVRRLPGPGHAAALRHLGRNVQRHSCGLPDLFLWNDADYRFVEIKAENDHLSGHQFEWLRVLSNAGINVSLEKVVRPR